MSHKYVARYTASNSTDSVDLNLDANTDAKAVAEVRQIVAAGYRNEASCIVTLRDGRSYGASNHHGNAVGAYQTFP